MKTLLTTALLSAMFLSAGAFARDSELPQAGLARQPVNLTVVMKNQSWPEASRISVEPCARNRCIDI
jgi:hypothetical protein